MVEVENKVQRYESYKESGVEWLEEIPEHWEVKKVFHFFKAEKGKRAATLTKEFCGGIKGVYPVYSGQTENDGVMSSINEFEFNYSIDGCLFTTTVGAKAMTVNFLQGKFSLSQNCMIIVKKNNEVFNKFTYYQFQTLFAFYRNQIPDHMQASFRMDDLYQYKFILPPLAEQTKIAQFLDDKTTKIEDAIAIKQQQINLLKERKQILIHKAVTRGLEDSVTLKDSGVEWIGEIPEHWEVNRLKMISSIINGATPSSSVPSFWNGDIVWVTPTDINDVFIINSSERTITKSGYKSCGTTKVPKGSIVLTTRAPIGKLVIAGKELCTNQGCKSLVLKEGMETNFIYFQLSICSDVLNSLGTGTTFMELSNKVLKNFLIAIPPISEQKEISDYIETASQKIETVIDLKQREIEKLKEYKSSLINGVVTGKVRVC